MVITSYYKLSPEKIVEDVHRSSKKKRVQIKGSEYLVYPGVYPSDRFRTTDFILDAIKPLLQGKVLCDMGCGIGIIGLFALQHGAKRVVQADINPIAVENAKANRKLFHYSQKQIEIFESNCFDNIPDQTFDIIVFNIPFHSEPYSISHPLEYAFHDPNFASTRKFLLQTLNYCHPNTEIFIAFSTKGNVGHLEELFDVSGFHWQLWARKNTDQKHDNRLYRLTKNEL